MGGAIEQKHALLAEEKKQMCIRLAEERVREEERVRYEQQLADARAKWREERRKLSIAAQEEQHRAIMRESTAQEERLREEFAHMLEHLAKEHESNLQETITKTLLEADAVKNSAVEEARLEEKELAKANAEGVAEEVRKQSERTAKEAEDIKQAALNEQKTHIHHWHDDQQQLLRNELQQYYADKLAATCEEHETQLASLQEELQEERNKRFHSQKELSKMTQLKDDWKFKYDKLKMEFSHFIDQFPGFKGEFILK